MAFGDDKTAKDVAKISETPESKIQYGEMTSGEIVFAVSPRKLTLFGVTVTPENICSNCGMSVFKNTAHMHTDKDDCLIVEGISVSPE